MIELKNQTIRADVNYVHGDASLSGDVQYNNTGIVNVSVTITIGDRTGWGGMDTTGHISLNGFSESDITVAAEAMGALVGEIKESI